MVDKLPMSDDFAEEIRSIPGITIEEVVFNGGEEFLPIFSISNDCEEAFHSLINKIIQIIYNYGNKIYGNIYNNSLPMENIVGVRI
jgi:hypothetical protein